MKKVSTIIIALIALGLIWYLFFKPYDYTIRFEANTTPGTINQSLKLWDQDLNPVQKVRQDGNLYHLTQKLKFGDSIYNYFWNIEPITDSTSKVVVTIKDLEHSFMNKIKVPFVDTDFEKQSRKTVLDFMENLKEHTEHFKVSIEGEGEIPEKYVAYLPVKVTQFQKARGMMKDASYIEQTIIKNNIALDGPPMLEITKWNKSIDSLEYNFCYPIVKTDSLPTNTELKYKRIFKKKAIKAIYNGNYITSDRAWYALIDYAKANNIKIEEKPTEIFYSNPNTGGDELSWKAEIYMPIKETDE